MNSHSKHKNGSILNSSRWKIWWIITEFQGWVIYELFGLLPHGGATLAGELQYPPFFPKPSGRNPRNKIHQFRMSKSDFCALWFCSVWQAGLPLVRAKSMARKLSQLFKRVQVELRHCCFLFRNVELWYVFGILKRVSWEAGLGVLWVLLVSFHSRIPQRSETRSSLSWGR